MATKSSATASAVLAVAAVGVTAVTTHWLTKRQLQKNQLKEKLRAHKDQQAYEQQLEEAQKKSKKKTPKGTLIQDVTIDKVYLYQVEHLSKFFSPEKQNLVNHMDCLEHNPKYNKLIDNHECILGDLVRKPSSGQTATSAYVRAGPRKLLHFDPKHVNAAIVTCGGLCPGLNNVIREITNSLYNLYGIQGKVYGIRGGYRGFYDPALPPLLLTPESVEHIHHLGGTILASSRGGFDLNKIVDFIKKHNIKQLYVIGGDGTHRGAFTIHEGCMERGLNISVAGIPKTIDNDIDYIDHSFGFSSAVEAAQASIHSAKTEAMCNLPNGIGIVKLMGRSAGFIAVHATMASGDVDLCLVPEVPTVLEGEDGCLPHLRRRVQEQGWAVVVVAEGAGEEILGTSTETDASGNKILPKIGDFLKTRVQDYFKEQGDTATVKYIDPSYLIRSIPANAADSLYCMQLAQNAVHGAMAGFTGFSVGLCNNRMVFLPIPELVATSPRNMNPRGRTWERVLAVTRQPNTVPPPSEDEDPYSHGHVHAPMLR